MKSGKFMGRFAFLILSVMILISGIYLEDQKAQGVFLENITEKTIIYIGTSDVTKFSDKLCTKDMLNNMTTVYNFVNTNRLAYVYLLILSMFLDNLLHFLLKNHLIENRILSFEPFKKFFLVRYIHKEDGKKRWSYSF